MNCVPRPERLPIALVFIVALLGGCSEKPVNTGKSTNPEQREEVLAGTIARLERDNDATTSREVLATVDTLVNPRDPKPELNAEQLATMTGLLKLSPTEADAFAQPNFSAADGDYLADCFILRDAMRSLELGKAPPIVQAERAFAWTCRQVYTSRMRTPPAPAWWVLHASTGTGLDRAYVFLGALQQLGLEGFLIGPPELERTPSFTIRQDDSVLLAPFRAIGVRIADQVYLFDPWNRKPVAQAGKIASLASVRADPAAFKSWLTEARIPAEEVARWQLFIAAPIQAYQPRMAWLQRQIPASNAVRLAIDLPKLLDDVQVTLLKQPGLAGVSCRLWNPPDDPFALLRVVSSFSSEPRASKGEPTITPRGKFVATHFPWQFLPRLQVDGAPLSGEPQRLLSTLFQSEFSNLLFVDDSPRDNVIRGNFGTAITALTDQKDRNERLAERARKEAITESDIDKWSRLANTIFAASLAAEEKGDSTALLRAKAEQANFLRHPLTEKMAILVRRITSMLLSADAAFQLALVMHERADQAYVRWTLTRDDKSRDEAIRLLKNAIESWQRYLDNHPLLRSEFRERDQHAGTLQKQAREMQTAAIGK